VFIQLVRKCTFKRATHQVDLLVDLVWIYIMSIFLPLAACVQTGVSRSGLVGRSRGQVASRAVESGQQGIDPPLD
jgi:hypothetical protein